MTVVLDLISMQVSLSAFSFLFRELVQYAQGRSTQLNINDLERRYSLTHSLTHSTWHASYEQPTNRTVRFDLINDIACRLCDLGASVGARLLDLLTYREKGTRRELRLVGMLSFVQTIVWKALFGKPADSLERSIEHEDECMRSNTDPAIRTTT
jgi:hypothetical protein